MRGIGSGLLFISCPVIGLSDKNRDFIIKRGNTDGSLNSEMAEEIRSSDDEERKCQFERSIGSWRRI